MEFKRQIFLNYAREDRGKVEELYLKLVEAGFKPWMDIHDIISGEWEKIIEEAIWVSGMFLVCLTKNSAKKRGPVQVERNFAWKVRLNMLPDDIYIQPIRLEDCEIPDEFRGFQVINLFDPEGWNRLVKTIKHQMKSIASEEISMASEQEKGSATEECCPNKQSVNSSRIDLDMRNVDWVFFEQGSHNVFPILYWRNGRAITPQSKQSQIMHLSAVRSELSRYLFHKEIFLCLRGDLLIEGYELAQMRRLLDVAKSFDHKANIYVVKDRNIGVSGFEFDSMARWFDEVIQGGATDIIEIEMIDRYSPGTISEYKLNTGADFSRRRREIISPINPEKKWTCLLPTGTEYFLSWFLRPFVVPQSQQLSEKNAVLVIKHGGHKQRFESMLRSSTGQYVPVWLNTEGPSRALQKLCLDEDLKLIHCRGPFELRFLLLRLNQYSNWNNRTIT